MKVQGKDKKLSSDELSAYEKAAQEAQQTGASQQQLEQNKN